MRPAETLPQDLPYDSRLDLQRPPEERERFWGCQPAVGSLPLAVCRRRKWVVPVD